MLQSSISLLLSGLIIIIIILPLHKARETITCHFNHNLDDMAPSFDNKVPTSPVRPSKHATPHPFAPLSGLEITNAASIIRKSWPQDTDVQFRVITLREPDKSSVIPFLESENNGRSYSVPVARKAFIVYYLRNTDKLHEAVVDLSEQKVEYNVRLGPNVHANLDGETILLAEKFALNDEGVKAALTKLQLPDGAVVVCDVSFCLLSLYAK